MRHREMDHYLVHPLWHAWQRQVRLGETSLGLEEWALRSTQEGPADPAVPYSLDEPRLRAFYRNIHEDDMPYLQIESPARSIDEIVADCSPFISGGSGVIQVYPLIYDGDPDGLLIAFGAPERGPRVVGPMDWDDVASSDYLYGGSLTVQQIIAIVNNVIREANVGLALA